MNSALISADRARLPQTYEAARAALSECSRIDECQDWADKAEALASYAKQADDDTLRKLADRIQARAVRRAGKLLEVFKQQGARNDRLPDGAVRKFTQTEAAERAGMSERQRVTAVRVANVPEEVFEAAVEGPRPPTVTKLADMGRAPRPNFKQATHLLGSVRRFAEFCSDHNPHEVAQGVLPSEARELREQVSTIDNWLDRFVTNLEG
jgi:hypothetical protein